jgi:DNA-binding phage protein
MSVTRRGFLQGLVATTATTALIVRPTEAVAVPDPILEGEIIEDELLPEYSTTYHHSTRLEVFMKSRGIRPAHLARESGYSRQHLLRIRMGRMEPTRRCMVAIVRACGRLSREQVRATDLFDLGGA